MISSPPAMEAVYEQKGDDHEHSTTVKAFTIAAVIAPDLQWPVPPLVVR
jgi:hypothetical protein